MVSLGFFAAMLENKKPKMVASGFGANVSMRSLTILALALALALSCCSVLETSLPGGKPPPSPHRAGLGQPTGREATSLSDTRPLRH